MARTRPLRYSTPAALRDAREAMRGAAELVLLLDYDGTLVPMADAPHLAVPDAALLGLLARLARRPRTAVHVVSGRGRDALDAWLGRLPIALHAEHGSFSRPAAGAWTGRELPPDDWRGRALELLEDFAGRTPGSLVEQKSTGLAWHYRLADPEDGPRRAHELQARLSALLAGAPVELLAGDQVVELRPRGAHKGRIAAALLPAKPGALLAAFGDDRTDEDLFNALPPPALTVHVGPAPSVAGLRLPSVAAVRALLESLLA